MYDLDYYDDSIFSFNLLDFDVQRYIDECNDFYLNFLLSKLGDFYDN